MENENYVEDKDIPELNKYLVAMNESLKISLAMHQMKPNDVEIKKIHAETLVRKGKIERILKTRVWEKIF
jgi:hypothetical protein